MKTYTYIAIHRHATERNINTSTLNYISRTIPSSNVLYANIFY